MVASKTLQRYILKNFLLEKVIEPIIEKSIEGMNKQAAFIQIITNLTKSIIESKENKDAALEFLRKRINNKIVVILDLCMNNLKENPILFEKGLKLLASLSKYPNFKEILTNTLDSHTSSVSRMDICDSGTNSSPNKPLKHRFTKYLITLRDLLFSSLLSIEVKQIVID